MINGHHGELPSFNSKSLCELVQVILFRSILHFFYTNLHKLFSQLMSWTNWVNLVNLWKIAEYHVQLWVIWKKKYDDLMIINGPVTAFYGWCKIVSKPLSSLLAVKCMQECTVCILQKTFDKKGVLGPWHKNIRRMSDSGLNILCRRVQCLTRLEN